MEKASLARKQKRLIDWNKALDDEGASETVKLELGNTLKLYRNSLARLWEAEEITADDIGQLTDLERQIQTLHTASRYHK